MARSMWCTWNKWLTLSHVIHDVIKGKKKIKKIRKKNMVMTSGQGGKWGGSFPHLIHTGDGNLKDKMRRKEKMERNEKS